MMKKQKGISYFSIRRKLLILCALLIIINSLMISIFAYFVSMSFIKQQSLSVLSNVQKQKKIQIENNMKEFENIVDVILHDAIMNKFIAGKYTDITFEVESLKQYVEPVLGSVVSSKKDGVYLSIIRYNNSPIEIIADNFENILDYNYMNFNWLSINRKFYHVINEKRMLNKSWFKNLYKTTHGFDWMQIGMDKEFDNISYLGEIKDVWGDTTIIRGMIRVCVSIEKLLSEEKCTDELTQSVNFVFDKNGNLLSGVKENKILFDKYKNIITRIINKPEQYIELANNKVFFISKIKNGWTIVSMVPIVDIYKTASHVKYYIIFFNVIIITILFSIVYIIINSFTQRIKDITKMMERFKEGDFNVQITDNNKDELSFMSNVFNEMVKQIKILIEENYKFNIDKKDAQLKVLQAQIKPHMLYNSLSAISRLAEKKDFSNIKNMVKALCNFYRLSLNNGMDYLSIYQEIQHLKSYISVYSIRKNKAFNIYYKIDDNIYVFDTINTMLQPFVENCFEHAIYDSMIPINIIVEGYIDGDSIIFKIIDDGIGIKRDSVKTILDAERESYGIKNINQRIKIHFGQEYGVQIYSIYGAGTTVLIKIPKTKLLKR